MILKALPVLLFALSPLTSFAGPEEHMSAQVCFRIPKTELPNLSRNVPSEICLEEVSLNVETAQVSIYSYFFPKLYKNLQTDSVIRNTEDTFVFKASNVIYSDWSAGCSSGELARLTIAGQTDYAGVVESQLLDQLKIQVKYTVTPDTCHSKGTTKVYTYSAFN